MIILALRKSFSLLSKNEKIKLTATGLVQALLAFLDLLGVMLLGAIAALAINGISNKGPGNRVSQLLDFFGLRGMSLQEQTVILSVLSASLLIFKTFFSFWLNRKTAFFLSRRSAIISSEVFEKLLKKDLVFIRKRTSQEILQAVISAVQGVVNNLLVTAVSLTADSVTATILLVGLAVLDWKMAAFCVCFYGSLAIVLHFGVRKKYDVLSRNQVELQIQSNSLLIDSINGFRDIVVRSIQDIMIEQFKKQRLKLSHFAAEFSLSSNLSKYFMEIGFVIGAILISAYQFATQDASRAIATLTIFIATSTRIVPSVLRIQQGFLIMRSTAISSYVLFDLLDDLNKSEKATCLKEISTSNDNFDHSKAITISNLKFQYPTNSSFELELKELSIEAGAFVALVGPSGGGKSTIVDLLLGVIRPDAGSINLNGKNPRKLLEEFKGYVGYVPQEIILIDGSIKDNICFYADFKESDLKLAIEMSQLSDLISSLPDGYDTQVGERGARLSGGQRQRLGIARALYTNPKILILDEATSALDGKTEGEISGTLRNLKSKKTIVVIAHRLSTVRNADKIFYIDQGKVMAQGSFQELRKKVPDFDIQAKLMNL